MAFTTEGVVMRALNTLIGDDSRVMSTETGQPLVELSTAELVNLLTTTARKRHPVIELFTRTERNRHLVIKAILLERTRQVTTQVARL